MGIKTYEGIDYEVIDVFISGRKCGGTVYFPNGIPEDKKVIWAICGRVEWAWQADYQYNEEENTVSWSGWID